MRARERFRSIRFRLTADADPPHIHVEFDRVKTDVSATAKLPKPSVNQCPAPALPKSGEQRPVTDFLRYHWVEGAWVALIFFFTGAYLVS